MTGSICYNYWCNALYSSNKYLGICYKYWGNVSVAAIYKYPMIRCCFCLNREVIYPVFNFYTVYISSLKTYIVVREGSYGCSDHIQSLKWKSCWVFQFLTAGQLLILMSWDWSNFLLLCYMQTVQRLFKLEQINLYPWDFK